MNQTTVAALLESLTQHYHVAQEHFSTSPYNLAIAAVLGLGAVVFFVLWRTAGGAQTVIENKPLEKAYSELMEAHRSTICSYNALQNNFLTGINKLNSDHSITLRTTIEQLSSTDE
jgi:hypothetical protein